ncbi:hypothetical protein HN799_02125 [Candidatus Woesearchaeota archaeon]|jgi:hypothetical protein|nr:hypothetical protein [Candidatus Woesearchaeota archaeon]
MSKTVVKELDNLVKNYRNISSELQYNLIKKIVSNKELYEKISIITGSLFEKITFLYNHGLLTDKRKKIIIGLISDLHNQLNQSSLENIQYDVKLIKEWLSHQREYVNYFPGAENKSYVRLTDLIKSKEHRLTVNKAILEYSPSKEIFYDGKKIQGLQIKEKLFNFNAELTAEHYTWKESLKDIYNSKNIYSSKELKNSQDSYCYFAEPGKLNGQSMMGIKKILGANSAESCITIKLLTTVGKVWIRVERGKPAKFAIEAKSIPFKAPKPQKGFTVRIGDEVPKLWAA